MNEFKKNSAIDLLKFLQTPDFAAEVGVASDYTTAKQIALHHPASRELLSLMQGDLRVVEEVISLVRDLCNRPIDPRYESPWDVVLLTLTLLIRAAAPDCTQLVPKPA